jgi:hypothetical protein
MTALVGAQYEAEKMKGNESCHQRICRVLDGDLNSGFFAGAEFKRAISNNQ